MGRAVMICLALMLSAGPAWSAELSARQRELSGRYMRAVHMTERLDEVMKMLMPTLMAQAVANGDMPDADKAAFLRVANETANEVMNELMPKMLAEMEAVIGELYSEEELSQAITFYETPAGRTIIAKSPQVNERIMARTQPLGEEAGQLMIKRMLEKLCPGGSCSAPPRTTGA